MKYLITGKNGQLAREFMARLERESMEWIAPDEAHLDITDETKVTAAVHSFKPDVIINCAAYNFVDQAEQDRETAFLVNARGPANLARAAERDHAVLVHFGSDYVFDGLKETGLYIETDEAKPLNEYGKSKLAGERNVLEQSGRILVLRLSWVFGTGAQNFIYKFCERAESDEYLKVTCDEFSVPTYTGTVVDVTMKALKQGLSGRFHVTNSGYCSRYEWAKVILESRGIKKFIRPVSMADFKLPAQRPKFSAMSNESIASSLGMTIPSWDEAVRHFLRKGGPGGE